MAEQLCGADLGLAGENAERGSYWNRCGIPAVRPLYYTIESPNDDHPPWPIVTWWLKEPASSASDPVASR